MADTQVAPAPEPATITIPAPTLTAGWAVPAGQQAAEPKEAKEKPAKKRGIPAGPALAATGNATAMGLTAAAEAGGLPALAAAGGVVALGAVAAVVRRRRQVRRRSSLGSGGFGSGGSRGGSWGGSGTGSSWGSRGSGSGGSRTSAAGSPWRTSTGSAGSSGGGSRSGSGSPAGAGSHGSGTGSTASGPGSQRTRNRRDGGSSAGSNGSNSNRSQKSSKTSPSAASRAAKTTAGHVGRAAAGAGRLAGAGASKAWKTSKPLRTKSWAAAKKAGRKSRGFTADALRAIRTGVWGTLRHWSIKKGLAKAWAAWKQHRANRKNKTTDPAKPEPTISSVVRKPTNQITRTANGGTLMPGHHFTGPAMEMARAAAAYEPTGMLQVGADFAGLQEGLELVAEAMRVTVDKADAQHPLDPQIVDLMKQIHGLQLKASELAAELQPAFKSLHQVDLARLENPRKGIAGERMWDVSTNLS